MLSRSGREKDGAPPPLLDPPSQRPDLSRCAGIPSLAPPHLLLPTFSSVDSRQQSKARATAPARGGREVRRDLTGARLRQPAPAPNWDPPNPGAAYGGRAVLSSTGELARD
ncbi:hypothetical protein VPH35_055716 [Triticum aestivum]